MCGLNRSQEKEEEEEEEVEEDKEEKEEEEEGILLWRAGTIGRTGPPWFECDMMVCAATGVL